MLEFVLQAAEAMFPIIALVALGSFLSRAGWFDAVRRAGRRACTRMVERITPIPKRPEPLFEAPAFA